MREISIETDLVRKALRSVSTKRETLEEIQERYTSFFPPTFLFKGSPSVSLKNLDWALRFLVQNGYVTEEVTRFIEYELKEDTKVYSLTQKGLAYLLKKK